MDLANTSLTTITTTRTASTSTCQATANPVDHPPAKRTKVTPTDPAKPKPKQGRGRPSKDALLVAALAIQLLSSSAPAIRTPSLSPPRPPPTTPLTAGEASEAFGFIQMLHLHRSFMDAAPEVQIDGFILGHLELSNLFSRHAGHFASTHIAQMGSDQLLENMMAMRRTSTDPDSPTLGTLFLALQDSSSFGDWMAEIEQL
ncbi:hypothetical protein PTTG_04763 [Puccinia triticina 1-1 BBBD Race 1]|uniref:Uncharacterized protein n=1 Tax=Puccinia triticina (isolate 1-1 / race 1 (BBBD)) TaxID=630390 RepID=A0A0C4EVD0_PUCT1|nr:hypothetical protein PTTG_04763 [Puccinia triticina 1-1 BBBD Race 1]